MKQKGIAMALAAALVAGSLPMGVGAAQFSDLNETAWAAKTITEVANKGLLSGYQDGTFRGKNGVTYCETTTMLHNVLTKGNALQNIPATSFSMYQPVMNNYKIPQWAQYGVTYCLGAEIMTPVELTKFMQNGKSMPADRQSVAMLFGKALAKKYDVYAARDAKEYRDAGVIAKDALPYINLLTKLGILSGDENNKFNPYSQITRAEMAVIMNKTFDLLTNEMSNTGKITEITNQDGKYYDVDVNMTSGEKKKITISDDTISVLTKAGKELPVSSLSVGDEVSLVFNGALLEKIYLLGDEAGVQKKYDMTGYISSIKNDEVRFESENTGEVETYKFDSSCTFYQDGKKSTKADVKKLVEENSNRYVYAGLTTKTKQERKDNGKLENVTYITAMDVRIQDEYTSAGKLQYIKDDTICYKLTGSRNEQIVSFAKGCTFYIGEKEASLKELQKMADSGDVYVKVSCGADKKATKVVMAEDTFTDTKKSVTYTVKAFTEDEIRVYHGGDTHTYEIASTKDVSYYTWNGKWESCEFQAAERFYDYADDTVYARINLNNKGKLSEIYLVDGTAQREAAFDEAEESERKGTVASIKDGKLKFETSSITYKLKEKYKTTSPNQTLIMNGAFTNSLTLLERMANCDDLTLYAEIKANIDNEVTKIETRLTDAKGRIVKYDYDEKELTIQTEDGSEFRLETKKNPETGTKEYEAKDLGTTSYKGSEVRLSFDSNGIVNQILVTDKSNGIGFTRVSGKATADGDNVKIDGKSYRMSSKTNISSKSFNYDSVYTIRDLLADSSLKLYANASVDDKDFVENLSLKMQEATGTFQEYDTGSVQIKTKDGEYVFHTVSKAELAKACGLDDVDQLNDWEGKQVTLVFNSDGIVSEVEK